jgi:hypothetical protein
VQTVYPRRFGRYVLVELLGLGGMGEVALAICGRRASPQLCVIKRLFPDCRGDRVVEERFRREGELVAKLFHRGLSRTLEVGRCEGEQFIAQEFIAGRDLGQLLASCASGGTRLPVPVAMHIVVQVAEALAYVHDAGNLGVVHRDVSPSNVRLSWQGEVKLIDFGIARAAAQAGLTQNGQSVGRPKYMAPELLAGGQATRATDVYALGVVLWEMLTGRSFGDGKGTLRASNPEVADGLEKVVLKASNPVSADRFASTHALRDALVPFLPERFAGDAALRELLASRWDVARETRLRDAAVEGASALLEEVEIRRASETAKIQEKDREWIPELPRRRVWPWATGVLVLAGTVAVAWRWHDGGQDGRRGTASGGVSASTGGVRGTGGVRVGVEAEAGSGGRAVVAAPTPNPATLFEGFGTDSLPRLTPGASRSPIATTATATATNMGTATATRNAGRARGKSGEALLDDAQEAYRAGAVEQAIGLARRAARSGAGARARIMAGRMLVHENRLAEAEGEFAAAVRLAPDDEEAAQWLARVRAGGN